MSIVSPATSPLQIATTAIRRSQQELAKDAHVVANAAEVDTPQVVEALVDARQQVLYTRSAAKIIRAADEMTKSLIDVRA